MKYRPHTIFRKSQYSVQIELPNDVFYDFMCLLKQVNKAIEEPTGGYILTGDDLICMAIEDFNERYIGNLQTLLRRLGTA